MATSSTAKKASTGTKKSSTAAKKPAEKKPTAPKPYPATVAEQDAEATQNTSQQAPKTIQEFEHVAAVASRKAEQNVKKAMQDDDLVTIQVPPIPGGKYSFFSDRTTGILSN